MDAQQQQDELLKHNRKAVQKLSPSQLKRELAASRAESTAGSSSGQSSLPTGLVEAVMQKHGVSEERALELLKEFGA